MGSSLSSKKKAPPVIASCEAPIYCVKRMGARHLFVAGGGGSAKTGVLNNMEALLLTFDPAASFPLAANLTTQFGTKEFATMNLDLIPMGPPQAGLYLLAAGHDQYCDIYETTGFSVDSAAIASKKLSLGFKIREVAQLTTDENAGNAYQKCVLFDRSRGGQRLMTGGSDGHVRIWDIREVQQNQGQNACHRPLIDILAHQTEVEDIDLSQDGAIMATVGDGKAVVLWDSNTGNKISEIVLPKNFEGKYKVRSVRFVPSGENRYVFVIAFNQIQRTSKSNAYLALWAFNKERNTDRLVTMQEIPKQAISKLTVSPCGDYTGVGTLGGSVGIYDTHDLKPLHWAIETHGIFVTGLEFVERQANDIATEDGKFQQYPGVAAAWKVALVSLSADKTVQLHTIPIATPTPLATILFWVSLCTLFIQMLFLFISKFL